VYARVFKFPTIVTVKIGILLLHLVVMLLDFFYFKKEKFFNYLVMNYSISSKILLHNHSQTSNFIKNKMFEKLHMSKTSNFLYEKDNFETR
jgi:hypothetical protein